MNDVGRVGRIYSIGYEGMSLRGFTDCMAQNSIEVVIDVRLNPVSRRPGFSKRSLQAALAAVGVEYVHEPDLGNPVDNRQAFRTGDAEVGRERMEHMLANGSSAALGRVAELARSKRIAVLCVERDHRRCHRSVITDALVVVEPELEVLHVA